MKKEPSISPASNNPKPIEEKKNNDINQLIIHPTYPENLNFCGERVPLERADIREAFETELIKSVFWHSEMILYIKRMYKTFAVVVPILKKYNVPEDFKYLLVAESGMINVISPAKATGYWQFMEKTAKEYGLTVNEEIDERYDLEKSTEAACKYILKSYERLNNWTLVAASYNSGVDYILDAMKKQKVNSFYDLLLNVETAKYIYRILAYKIILENPQNYGFNIDSQYYFKPIPTTTLEVNFTIENLADFAIANGTTYRQIKLLNPWIMKDRLTVEKGRKVYIKIPKKAE